MIHNPEFFTSIMATFGFGGAAAGGAGALTEGFCQTPGNPDSISKLAWTKGSSQFIATSNWDGQVRLYVTQPHQQHGFCVINNVLMQVPATGQWIQLRGCRCHALQRAYFRR
jgi:hypothetical protein